MRILVVYASKTGGTEGLARMIADAKGFLAKAMARKMAGDWRDPGQAAELAGRMTQALATLAMP